MQTQQNNISEDHFNFQKYSILISQISVNTIEKLEQIGEIKSYVISQG